MNFQVDLDPKHSVIRLTVIEEILSLEVAQGVYELLSRISSYGGPYAAIYDLSMTRDTTIPTEMIRSYAHREPSIPLGRTHVVVGKHPVIYGLARIFQMCQEYLGDKFEVVHSLEEAYERVGARHEDFTQRLYPREMAA